MFVGSKDQMLPEAVVRAKATIWSAGHKKHILPKIQSVNVFCYSLVETNPKIHVPVMKMCLDDEASCNL